MAERAPLLAAASGLAAERALVDQAADAGWTSLLWRSQPAVVITALHAGRPGFAALRADFAGRGLPVEVRDTGGGVVVQSPDCLTVAVAWAWPAGRAPAIAEAFTLFCRPLQEALAELGLPTACGALPGSFCDGSYNLLCDGRKLAGTAQRWRQAGGRWIVLAEAVILCGGDRDRLADLTNAAHAHLTLPDRVTADRHVTLAELLPSLAPVEEAIEAALSREFGGET